jgi:hypothetical protein
LGAARRIERIAAVLENEEDPICIGPLDLFLLLALRVSLLAMLASILRMLLGIR